MNEYKQKVIAFFNHRTAYDQEGEWHPKEARKLLNMVPVKKGDKILDIATGTGLLAIDAAQKIGTTGHVIGVDFSPVMLNQAREKITALGLNNIELIESDAELIEFASNSFDAIFCCSALVFIPDIPAILVKWYDWLKFGGYIAFSTPGETAYMSSLQMEICQRLFNIKLPHILEPLNTPEKCRHLLQRVGFRDIKIEIQPSGEYLSLTGNNNPFLNWRGESFYPRGNPLLELSEMELEQLQTEYRTEIQKLATPEGVWLDRTTYYVIARDILPALILRI
ncbi:MAG: methyltransferase domain-containing protein [Nostocaceae cyanobacterium]|nr:methyltransferase domain-containing protein [Nostocaceae cyanobacterium]